MALQNSTLDYGNYGGSINFGTLTSATLGGLNGSQNLALVNSSTAAVALSIGQNDADTIYSGVLSGSGSLLKIGEGVLTLAGTNTYSGSTTIDGGGTLNYTANNSVTSLIFGAASSTPFSSTPSTLSASANVSAGSLLVQVNSTAPNTVDIDSGKTFTINGPVTIGPNLNGVTTGQDAGSASTVLAVTGDGTLVINAGANSMYVGQLRGNGDPGTDPQVTLDLSELDAFTYSNSGTGELRIGYGGNVAGNLLLAANSNTITTATIQIGNSNGQNSGGTSTLSLAQAPILSTPTTSISAPARKWAF